MELVKGIPITHYCDHEKLCTKARLDLFIKECQAIQHAHHILPGGQSSPQPHLGIGQNLVTSAFNPG
jgi:hypothetical protein